MTDLHTFSLEEGKTTDNLKEIFVEFFNVSNKMGADILDAFTRYTSHLRNEISLVIETNYVDKVYRDSYYCYYSTKLESYPRNCIKISFFDVEVNSEMFYDQNYQDELSAKYLGFMVIRPLSHNPIGRSVISPKALAENNIRVCNTLINSTMFGLKLDVIGFPHSSQDCETMTCAETTIWALMEYFGSKYPEYKPTLPSRILRTLEHRAFARQIPSKGLIYEDISYALREQGFGTVVYSCKHFGDDHFKRLFSCYVESGIPIVVAINNQNIGHALLCIGRDDILPDKISNMKLTDIFGEQIYEWNCNIEDFIFIDDNMPSYQKAKFDKPTEHYPSENWVDCKISHIIVPLYHKVYLEADNAISISNNIAVNEIKINTKSVIKTFLTSSRSYKNYIIKNNSIEPVLKDILITLELPKFIWITEVSSIDNLDSVKGVIILDATGFNSTDFSPFVFAHYKEHIFIYSKEYSTIQKIDLSLRLEYKAFEANLKLLK